MKNFFSNSCQPVHLTGSRLGRVPHCAIDFWFGRSTGFQYGTSCGNCGNPRIAVFENLPARRSFTSTAITNFCSSNKVSPLLFYHLNGSKYGFLSIFCSVFTYLCALKALSLFSTALFFASLASFRARHSIFALYPFLHTLFLFWQHHLYPIMSSTPPTSPQRHQAATRQAERDS